MKMKELEDRTGVGREAIRNYIREGLLPEPEKPHRNVAYYTEEYVNRITLIRRLKDERFLPLKVIRELLDSPDLDDSPDVDFVGLEALLTDRFAKAQKSALAVSEVIEMHSLTKEEVDFLATEGIVDLIETSDGPAISAKDVQLVEILSQLEEIGFDRESGYEMQGLKRYKLAADTLARQEVDDFFEHMPGTRSTDEAASLIEHGIDLTGKVISVLRTKAILRYINERNAGK